ncbi:MAG: hypothetical protein O7A03_08700 [Alphaproteobacteria bacterium]|nr:hypothetical protein [Alphaproteobacteria bacterium]
MFGIFELFGRSREIQGLDQAVRAVGLDARAVPDAVKFTTVRRIKAAGLPADARNYARAAELLGYSMLGATAFREANDERLTGAVEARIEAALGETDGLDAQLLLLTLHAGIIQASVIERYELTTA